MVAEVKNQQKLTRANSLKKEEEEKNTKASLDHAAARVVKIFKYLTFPLSPKTQGLGCELVQAMVH